MLNTNYITELYEEDEIMKIIFLGPPGVGKGTYASRIAEKLGIAHVSTGDIFRDAIKQNTDLGKKVLTYVQKGELVPDDITIEVFKDRISKPDCKKGFILDGYPRTLDQAKVLEKITGIDVVVNLTMDDKILIKKSIARRICKSCGEIYNVADIKEVVEGVEYNMPAMLPKNDLICDKCGGELIQREDDTEEIIRERLKVYKKQTKPLIRYYTEKGLVKNVFVTAGPEVMVPKIMEVLKKT